MALCFQKPDFITTNQIIADKNALSRLECTKNFPYAGFVHNEITEPVELLTMLIFSIAKTANEIKKHPVKYSTVLTSEALRIKLFLRTLTKRISQ